MTVLLCCNDDYGNMDHRLHAVECGAITIEPRHVDGIGFAFVRAGFRIRNRVFPARRTASCVGNVFWEAVDMELHAVVDLLVWARATRAFNCAEADERLYRWFDDPRVALRTDWIAHLLERTT